MDEDKKLGENTTHRRLGKELDLFVFSDLVGSGLPLFTPRGTILRDLLLGFLRSYRSKTTIRRWPYRI